MSEFFEIGTEETRSVNKGAIRIKVQMVTAAVDHVGDPFVLRPALDGGTLFRGCGRCGGYGQYSYNQLDGSMCYGCGGSGLGEVTTWEDAEKLVKSRRAARARRQKAEFLAAWTKAIEWDGFLTEAADVVRFLDGKEERTGFLGDMSRKAADLVPLSERMIAAVRRVIAEDVAKAEKNIAAGHFGVIGKREEIAVRVTMIREIEGQFGTTYLVVMTTPEGHALKTFASGSFGYTVEANKEYKIKATVKAHEEYNGRPQTIVTRAAFVK
jgi:hypothetical protein